MKLTMNQDILSIVKSLSAEIQLLHDKIGNLMQTNISLLQKNCKLETDMKKYKKKVDSIEKSLERIHTATKSQNSKNSNNSRNRSEKSSNRKKHDETHSEQHVENKRTYDNYKPALQTSSQPSSQPSLQPLLQPQQHQPVLERKSSLKYSNNRPEYLTRIAGINYRLIDRNTDETDEKSSTSLETKRVQIDPVPEIRSYRDFIYIS